MPLIFFPVHIWPLSSPSDPLSAQQTTLLHNYIQFWVRSCLAPFASCLTVVVFITTLCHAPFPLHTHTHTQKRRRRSSRYGRGDAGLFWLPLLKFYRIINFAAPLSPPFCQGKHFSWAKNAVTKNGRGAKGGGAETMMSFHVHLFRVLFIVVSLHIWIHFCVWSLNFKSLFVESLPVGQANDSFVNKFSARSCIPISRTPTHTHRRAHLKCSLMQQKFLLFYQKKTPDRGKNNEKVLHIWI